MKRQLSMFDRTHEMLVKSTNDAHEAYLKAQKRHWGQQHAKIIWQACLHAQMNYEIRHGMVSHTRQGKAAA